MSTPDRTTTGLIGVPGAGQTGGQGAGQTGGQGAGQSGVQGTVIPTTAPPNWSRSAATITSTNWHDDGPGNDVQNTLVFAGVTGDWTPIGAVAVSGGHDVAWESQSVATISVQLYQCWELPWDRHCVVFWYQTLPSNK